MQIFFLLLLSEPLNAGYENDLYEGDQHGKDKPGLNPLDIGGLGQLLDHTYQEDGGGQHQCDVHSDGSVEEV